MEMFKVGDWDLQNIGRNQTPINISVKGYWSRDIITIYIRRDHYGDTKWHTTISYGSGGRDTDVIKSDIEATFNFAMALVEATSIAKEIESKAELLETFYQDERQVQRKMEEAMRAEKQAKVDADAPISKERAEMLVLQLSQDPKRYLKLYHRGITEYSTPVTTSVRANVRFYIGGDAISKSALIEKIQEYSDRSELHAV